MLLICLPAGTLPCYQYEITLCHVPGCVTTFLGHFLLNYNLRSVGHNGEWPLGTPWESLTEIQHNTENGRKASIILPHSICSEAMRRLEPVCI